ncbi:hypothetical protein SLS62_011245 [Diatrype stigma]|uniref:DUF7729 domain-containing protein n=1 Tax=Diatrype stigma TaxID=117547 RepID=A0AAN9UBU2_9PEZI
MESLTSKCSPLQWARRRWPGRPGWRGPSPSNPVVSRNHRPRMHPAMIFLLLALSCLVSLTTAASSSHGDSATPRRSPLSAETLLVDTRIPVFVGGHWQIMSEDEHRRHLRLQKKVARRADGSSTSSSSSSGGDEATSTIAIPVHTTTPAASPLPSPFDGALAANFSGDNDGACPKFINSFLSDATFKQCYPFSLLLQGSSSFFEAEKSLVSITQVLDATCAADADFCTGYLADLAASLVSTANCAEDFAQQNSVVVQAHMGMLAYRVVYDAACLKDNVEDDDGDPDGGSSSNSEASSYCFASAVTNLTTTANAYLYFLPLNSTYPARASPDCDHCTAATLGVFQAATADRSQPIADTYEGAAARVNEVCGADFVNATLAAATEESAATTAAGSPASALLMLLPLLVTVLSHWW